MTCWTLPLLLFILCCFSSESTYKKNSMWRPPTSKHTRYLSTILWHTRGLLRWSSGYHTHLWIRGSWVRSGRGRWIFQSVKIQSMISFGREVKPWVMCCRFTERKRTSSRNYSLWAKFVGLFKLYCMSKVTLVMKDVKKCRKTQQQQQPVGLIGSSTSDAAITSDSRCPSDSKRVSSIKFFVLVVICLAPFTWSLVVIRWQRSMLLLNKHD